MPENDSEIFTLMLEPYGGCNLRCRHCYSHVQNGDVMGIEDFTLVVEKVAHYIEKKGFREIHFIWHGGEPLLAGIDFFRQAMGIVNKTISRVRQRHFIQTNGLLLDDEFCRFFRDMNIEVGVSLDGPPDLHDRLRVDSNGDGTHAAVMVKVRLLEKHQVPVGFNAVISRASIGHEQRLYRFFQKMGYGFRVNPIIPGQNPDISDEYLFRKGEYGEFLCRLFDIWTRTETQRINVSPLDIYLRSVLDGETSECQHQHSCVGAHIGIRPSGEAVLCSRFQNHGFGNILKKSMADIFSSLSSRQIKSRADALNDCRSCENWSICHGGCPCNSVAFGHSLMEKDPFCKDYQMIFAHIRNALTDYDHKYFKQKTI